MTSEEGTGIRKENSVVLSHIQHWGDAIASDKAMLHRPKEEDLWLTAPLSEKLPPIAYKRAFIRISAPSVEI
jgi:hypothetical protein